jgi:hypothetical protein
MELHPKQIIASLQAGLQIITKGLASTFKQIGASLKTMPYHLASKTIHYCQHVGTTPQTH